MNETLNTWVKNGWLTEHTTSSQEVSELLAVADRDLKDAQIEGISFDARLSIAYSAIIQCAKIGLALCGYRASRDAAHYRGVQSLALTLNISPELVRKLNDFRKKRNLLEYDRIGAVSQKEVAEILSLAYEIREKVEKQINRELKEKL